MHKNFLVVVFLLLKVVSDVNGFNYSQFYDGAGSNRDGKFLFDSLFGLEFEEDLIAANDATNTLKSCDCGE